MTAGVGWAAEADVVVVGSGAAGLTTAIDAAAGGLSVLVVTKGAPAESNTSWAQGGLAVVRDERDHGDSIAAHIEDTMIAGAGLSDPAVVAAILSDGPAAFGRLLGRGALFDAGSHGLERTREGGHSANRVVHAGGDATGSEIERALLAAAGRPAILAAHFALDLVRDETGAAAGITVLDEDGRLGLIHTRAVVLATGGVGHLFSATTNPAVATADGLAMALRAGAHLADVEFVQFHPTVLWTGPGERGHRPLVTEAVRGEGAVLIDARGTRVMTGVHPLGDLAPRDVVALAITRRLAENPGGVTDHVFLDATGLPKGLFARRFPTVTAACVAAGIDPTRHPIPVAPAAHYHCGGVLTDLRARTTVPGLYAVGEVARTGLHGANRLASNSLLEGLVMGERAARAVLADHWARSFLDRNRLSRELTIPAPDLRPVAERSPLQVAMSAFAGVGRTEAGMRLALALTSASSSALSSVGSRETSSGGVGGSAPSESFPEPHSPTPRWPEGFAGTVADRENLETANLALASSALLTSAIARSESRGCHVRTDFPGLELPAVSIVVRSQEGRLEVESTELRSESVISAKAAGGRGAAGHRALAERIEVPA